MASTSQGSHPLFVVMDDLFADRLSLDEAMAAAESPGLLQHTTAEYSAALATILSEAAEPEDRSRFHREFAQLDAATRHYLILQRYSS